MLGSRFDLAETLTEIAQREQVFDEQVVGGHAGATTVENELCPEVADLGYHCVELELQMAEVARLVHHNNPRISFRCPICDSRMQLSCETVMSEFAALDIKHHELSCDTCGLTTLRAFHALVGYQELPR